MNTHIAQARLLKAGRFADFLLAHLEDDATSFALGELSTDDWTRITELLNEQTRSMAADQEAASDLEPGSIVYKVETVPSFETRALIVSWFKMHEDRPKNVFSLFGGQP
jgi:hypothetical protein